MDNSRELQPSLLRLLTFKDVFTKADTFMLQTGNYHSLHTTDETTADFRVMRAPVHSLGRKQRSHCNE